MTSPAVLLGINVLLGLVSCFGAMWIRRMESDMKDMRDQQTDALRDVAARDLALQAQFKGYVAKEDFREFRDEQRENFSKLFERMDGLREQVARKVDRT